MNGKCEFTPSGLFKGAKGCTRTKKLLIHLPNVEPKRDPCFDKKVGDGRPKGLCQYRLYIPL